MPIAHCAARLLQKSSNCNAATCDVSDAFASATRGMRELPGRHRRESGSYVVIPVEFHSLPAERVGIFSREPVHLVVAPGAGIAGKA